MARTPTRLRVTDAYLAVLACLLGGYALAGKGFAYLGLPPLYIGDVMLLLGIILIPSTRCVLATATTLPSLVLGATITWVLIRTLPYLHLYGFDALRDSVVVTYGGFVFVVIALLLEDDRRINTMLSYYSTFLKIYIPVIPFVLGFEQFFGNLIPTFPGANVPLVEVRVEEAAVHLTGAALFSLVGFRKASPVWWVIVLSLLVALGALSRGAMLASFVPIVFATLMLGKLRQLMLTSVVAFTTFAVAYTVEPFYVGYVEPASSAERLISTRQVANNITSIFGYSDPETEGTKMWREDWWNIIMADTVYGPHFWTGRGFGLNLAAADGFVDGDHPDAPPLRSPHSVHMTMVARAGVPGGILWLCLLASWFAMMMRAMGVAKRRGQYQWASLFLFIICYVMSIVINASFDVAIEGPMQGIWFWCLIGFGIGSVMIYRCSRMSSLPRWLSYDRRSRGPAHSNTLRLFVAASALAGLTVTGAAGCRLC